MGTKNFGNYSDLITFTRASSGTALRPISYGDELVVNGTFDTDLSGWSVTSGGTISRDTIVFTNGGINVESTTANARRAYQSFGTTAGKTYALTLTGKGDGTNLAVVRIGVSEGDTSILSDTTVAAVGDAATTKTIIFNATTSTTFIGIGPTGAFVKNAYFDNISVREVLFDQPNGILTLFNHPTNVPRIEYDADGNRLGLLVEEARTNLFTYSEDFTTGSWSASGDSSVTSNYDLSLDGQQNATLLSGATTGYTGSNRLARVTNISSSTTYTFSVWVKLLTATTASIDLFDGSTGGLSRANSSATTEWQRLTVTRTSGASTSQFGISVGLTDGDILIYGAQLEAGSFPTSYIPTSGSTATRSADVASIGVSEFGYNQSAGTVVVGFDMLAAQANATAVRFNGDGYAMQYVTGSEIVYRVNNLSGNIANLALTTATPSSFKVAGVWKDNDFAGVANGGTVFTDNLGDVQTFNTVHIGNNTSSTGYLNGHIKSLKYYPRRLTNDQLVEVTS